MSKNLEPNVEKFMYFEKLFFKIQLFILGSGLFLWIFFVAIIEKLRSVNELFYFIAYFGIILPGLLFIVSIFRIFKYIIKISKMEGKHNIWRSALAFVFSPLNIGIFYILFIVLTFASCSVNA